MNIRTLVAVIFAITLGLLQGIFTIYIGGLEESLVHKFHLFSPTFSNANAALLFGSALGVLVIGPWIDLIGVGLIGILCSLLTTVGMYLFTISSASSGFIISEFAIGVGLSIWYPAPVYIFRNHLPASHLPYWIGFLMAVNGLGNASISLINLSSRWLGIVSTDNIMLGLCFFNLILACILFSQSDISLKTIDVKPKSLYGQLFRLLTKPSIFWISLTQALSAIYNFIFLPLWSIAFFSQVTDINTASIIASSTLFINGFGGLLLAPLYSRWLNPLNWLNLQFGITFFCILPISILPESSFNEAIIFACMWSSAFVLSANNAYANTYMTNQVPPSLAGGVSTITMIIFQLFVAILTFLMGYALDLTSYLSDISITSFANYQNGINIYLFTILLSMIMVYFLNRRSQT
ncbi:MAG: MFS transporter [Pseudomonadota bacterium]|nr:MFS transporter [Pseudomonadota bacterium]